MEYDTIQASLCPGNRLAGLEAAMEQWRGGGEFHDDVSLLALEFAEHQQERVGQASARSRTWCPSP
jgi:hypothetical protein